MKRKESQSIVKGLARRTEETSLSVIAPADETKPQGETCSVDMSEIPSCSKETECDILKRRYEEIRNENLSLKERIVDYENQQKLLQQHISDLEKQLKNYGTNFEERVKRALKDTLTLNQIDIALKRKSKARWTQEELSRAFALR